MRIAYFTQWWAPEPADVLGPLAHELAGRGHELQVITGFPNYPSGTLYPGHRMRWRERSVAGGIRTTRVPLYPSHDQSAARRALNYVSFGASATAIGLPHLRRPDVAYVYHPPITSAWPARVLRRLRGTPFLLHVQDLWPDSVTSSGMVGAGRAATVAERALRRMCATTYAAADHIVVISEGFREVLLSRGVPAEKISVVRNWADESRFRPRPPDPAVRAALAPPDARLVLYAGNLGHYQNLEAAVRAAAAVGPETGVHLVLVGDGLARAELSALVDELGSPHVRVLPPRPSAEMPPLLAAADAHLVSLGDLPFFAVTIPGKTQVALASGRPILYAGRGEAAELVERAGAGVACAPDVEGITEGLRALAGLSLDELRGRGEAGHAFYRSHLSLDAGTTQIEARLQAIASD